MHLLLILLCLLPQREPAPLTGEQRQKILQAIGERLDESAYAYGVPFEKWPELLAASRKEIDATTNHHDFGDAVNRALSKLGASHVYIKTPEVVKAARKGRRVGLGIGGIPVEGGVLAGFVIAQSPGWKAGIRRGDVILTVDHQVAQGPGQLRGKPGQEVLLTYQRNGKVTHTTAVAGPYPGSTPDYSRDLGDGYLLIAVHTFRDNRYKKKQIDELFAAAQEARGVILDLRGNLGGAVDNAYHLTGKMLPHTTPILRTIFRKDFKRYHRAHPDHRAGLLEIMKAEGNVIFPRESQGDLYLGPLVVLVDSLSGSAAELVAAALAESGRATLIGNTTRGKVLLSGSYKLPHGYRLQIPIGETVTFGGKRLEGSGVTPHHRFGPIEAANDQLMLKRARAILKDAATLADTDQD